MIKTSLYSLSLRGLTLASKFVLMLYMARFLAPEELGVYGLVAVTIALCLYLLGMDFYTFNTREILAREQSGQVSLIRDQLAFHGVVYLIVLPLLLIIFGAGMLPWEYVGWFYLLLVMEHLSQEANRLFTTLARPVIANVVLFLRSGAWVYAVVAAAFLLEDARNLSVIWSGWAVGVGASILLSAYFLRTLEWKRAMATPIDWGWIKTGFASSSTFFLATLALYGLQFVDRFFIQYFQGAAMLGVYTFYAGIANVVQAFVFTGVILILYPKIVSAYRNGRFEEYSHLMRRLAAGAIGGGVVLAIIAAVGILPVLQLVGKPIYAQYVVAYWILLAAMVALIIGQLPYYGLYVRYRDRSIVLASVIGLLGSLALNFVMVQAYGLVGASSALLISAVVLGLGRLLLLSKAKREAAV